jgi:transposase
MELHLTESERQSLKQFQRNVSERSSYVKVMPLLMLDKGLSPTEIADYLGIDGSTVYHYQQSYCQDGIDKYLTTDYKGYWGQLPSIQIAD